MSVCFCISGSPDECETLTDPVSRTLIYSTEDDMDRLHDIDTLISPRKAIKHMTMHGTNDEDIYTSTLLSSRDSADCLTDVATDLDTDYHSSSSSDERLNDDTAAKQRVYTKREGKDSTISALTTTARRILNKLNINEQRQQQQLQQQHEHQQQQQTLQSTTTTTAVSENTSVSVSETHTQKTVVMPSQESAMQAEKIQHPVDGLDGMTVKRRAELRRRLAVFPNTNEDGVGGHLGGHHGHYREPNNKEVDEHEKDGEMRERLAQYSPITRHEKSPAILSSRIRSIRKKQSSAEREMAEKQKNNDIHSFPYSFVVQESSSSTLPSSSFLLGVLSVMTVIILWLLAANAFRQQTSVSVPRLKSNRTVVDHFDYVTSKIFNMKTTIETPSNKRRYIASITSSSSTPTAPAPTQRDPFLATFSIFNFNSMPNVSNKLDASKNAAAANTPKFPFFSINESENEEIVGINDDNGGFTLGSINRSSKLVFKKIMNCMKSLGRTLIRLSKMRLPMPTIILLMVLAHILAPVPFYIGHAEKLRRIIRVMCETR